MNIFYLDENPEKAAIYQGNKHVVKMILESVQILCSAYPIASAPYKRTHYNHPCSIWTRTSQENYEWLIAHAWALGREYTMRYMKTHSSQQHLHTIVANYKQYITFPHQGFTQPAQAMPDEYRIPGNPVQAYRNYYEHEKLSILKYPMGKVPPWLSQYESQLTV